MYKAVASCRMNARNLFTVLFFFYVFFPYECSRENKMMSWKRKICFSMLLCKDAIAFTPSSDPSLGSHKRQVESGADPDFEGNVSSQSWRGFYQCSGSEKKTVQQAYYDASSLCNEAYSWVPGGRWGTTGNLYLGDDCGNSANSDIKKRFTSESGYQK